MQKEHKTNGPVNAVTFNIKTKMLGITKGHVGLLNRDDNDAGGIM